MKKELITHLDPKSPTSEIFRTLRTNLQFMSTNGKLKSLLVTSTMPGEGKGWVSSNLAVKFAKAGSKVILIDADMRKGRQYSIFGVSPKPGLSNYLSGVNYDNNDKDLDLGNYIQSTQIENLFIMSAGIVPPNPSELLVTEQMKDLIDRLKEWSDLIIIDGTPSQLVTDALILTRMVDSTLVVTSCNETKKEDLKRVINSIQQVGGKIAGTVLNKIPVSSRKYESKYYYYGSNSSKNNAKASVVSDKKFLSNQNEKIDIPRREESPKIPRDDLSKNMPNKMPVEDEKPLEKASDILKQINNYLEENKK